MATKNLQTNEAVIYVHCGPYTYQEKMLKIGRELLRLLPQYRHQTGHLNYAKD